MVKFARWELVEKPKFRVGDAVWVIYGREPLRARVLSIVFELRRTSTGNLGLICTGYRLDIANLDSRDWSFRQDQIYAGQRTARRLAKWHPVGGITEQEWLAAIGDRDLEDSIESCEMSICCAVISECRDILIECRQNGGLIERDLRTLALLLSEHDNPMLNGHRPSLSKILGQFGLGVLKK